MMVNFGSISIQETNQGQYMWSIIPSLIALGKRMGRIQYGIFDPIMTSMTAQGNRSSIQGFQMRCEGDLGKWGCDHCQS